MAWGKSDNLQTLGEKAYSEIIKGRKINDKYRYFGEDFRG